MKATLMILAVTASLSFLMTTIHGHTSFLQTVKDRYLVGHVTDRMKASSILSCAQHCLKRRPRCRSINYGEADEKKSCELNDNRSESTDTESSSFVSIPGFIFAQLLNLEHHKSCKEIQQKDPRATSGMYEIYPLTNADPLQVYCEQDIAGGGFTFLPHNLTLKSNAQQIIDSLFKDDNSVLLKLKKNVDGSEWYTLIQPHPDYTNVSFGVLVNSFTGYTQPRNVFMKEYIFLGILPNSVANKKTYQGFRSNGIELQFWNCRGNSNSYFAFFPNNYHKLPHGHGVTSRYENSGLAVNWRSHAKPVMNGSLKMPNNFFFLTELHFGGCGSYTSSDRWNKFGFNSTAIGIR